MYWRVLSVLKGSFFLMASELTEHERMGDNPKHIGPDPLKCWAPTKKALESAGIEGALSPEDNTLQPTFSIDISSFPLQRSQNVSPTSNTQRHWNVATSGVEGDNQPVHNTGYKWRERKFQSKISRQHTYPYKKIFNGQAEPLLYCSLSPVHAFFELSGRTLQSAKATLRHIRWGSSGIS